MAELTPYSYSNVRTPLHRLPAGWKLASLCALSFAAFFAGLPGLVAAAAATAGAAAVAGLSPARLFSGSRPLAVTTGLVVVLRSVVFSSRLPPRIALDRAGLAEGLLFASGVFVAFAAGSTLFATTTTAELRASLAAAERGLKRAAAPALPAKARARLLRIDFSLALALALAFIPRVFAVWEAASEAHAARCGRSGLRALAALLPLAAERLIEAAAETAAAMTSRGYEGARDAEPR